MGCPRGRTNPLGEPPVESHLRLDRTPRPTGSRSQLASAPRRCSRSMNRSPVRSRRLRFGVRGQSAAATPLWLTRPSIGHGPLVYLLAKSLAGPGRDSSKSLSRKPKRRVHRRSLQGEGRAAAALCRRTPHSEPAPRRLLATRSGSRSQFTSAWRRCSLPMNRRLGIVHFPVHIWHFTLPQCPV